MAHHLEEAQTAPTAVATLLGVLGGLGLVLASLGLYAVVAYTVTRRTREIGIRMALGARSPDVVWSIARGMAGLVGIGTGLGLGLSMLAMLALRAWPSAANGIGSISVYRPTMDPAGVLIIAGVTVMVGVGAAFVPARQAVKMTPLAALRHE
jgi:ABC-type antimicrobial peptide transport system permease subunit